MKTTDNIAFNRLVGEKTTNQKHKFAVGGTIRFLLLFLLICSSCNRKKQANVIETVRRETFVENSFMYYPIKDNQITVDLNKPQKASLFDYFKHIELIPLETNDDVLIANLAKILYFQNRFYIVEQPQDIVLVFDEKGKFVYKVKKRGQGPGQMPSYLWGMAINSFSGDFDLYCNIMIARYDSSWNHIKTNLIIDTILGIHTVYDVVPLTERINVLFTNFGGDYKIVYYDMDENKTIRQDYYETRSVSGLFNGKYVFYEYNRQWFYYRSYDNVTYLVDSTSLTKAYTWDFGKLNYDIRKMDTPDRKAPYSIKFDYLESMFPYRFSLQGQNHQYVIARIALRNEKFATLIYDKSIDDCKYINSFSEAVDFVPIIVTNEYVLSWCRHGALGKHVTEEMLDESNRQKLRDLMNSKEEENPIILKYYFK